MPPGWNPSTFIALAVVVVVVSTVSARVCTLMIDLGSRSCGQRMGRFVLPPGDPCTCTGVRLGGHYHRYAPEMQGQDPPLYMDMLPEVTAEVIGRWFNCTASKPEESTLGVTDTGPESTSKVAPGSTPVASAPTDTTPVVSTTPEPSMPPVDCQEILDAGQTTSGVYTIQHAGQNMQVYCRMEPESGKGYIVFQRRLDGSVSFDRTWQEYAEGFGDLTGEFWLGNQNLRALTEPPSETWELLITLTSFNNEEEHARYGDFSISGDSYALDVDDYDSSGQAGDSLTDLHERFFTTRDQDNDDSGGLNCARTFDGGWWYKKCKALGSNLNGLYYSSPSVGEYFGIQWVSWKGETYSLKSCEMKMRRNPTLSGHVGG